MKINHVSFDLWLTLIKSNPEYKKKRVEYFYRKFNKSNLSFDSIEAIIRKIDLMCDFISETTEEQIHAEKMYLMILSELCNNYSAITIKDVKKIKRDLDKLFLIHHPILISDKIVPLLKNLRKKGITLNILSNTGFIEGKILIRLLKKIRIYHYFSFSLFSDEFGKSKPSSDFFAEMIENAIRLHGNKINKANILHVGDNIKTDVEGAQKVGIKHFHITQQSPIDLYQTILTSCL